MIVVTISWPKNQTQSFSRFKNPKAAILKLKMLTGSALWFFIIVPEAARDKFILVPFPYS
jgi:hypothetical protein